MVPDKSIPVEDLPEISYDDEEIGYCPFCGNRFKICVKKDIKQTDVPPGPNEQTGCQQCTRCGYSWSKRCDEPKKCPQCGSYRWKEPAYKMTCGICHHKWISSNPNGPRRCPRCGTYEWMLLKDSNNIVFNKDPFENTLKRWICVRYENNMGIIEIALDLNLPVMKVANLVQEYYSISKFPKL